MRHFGAAADRGDRQGTDVPYYELSSQRHEKFTSSLAPNQTFIVHQRRAASGIALRAHTQARGASEENPKRERGQSARYRGGKNWKTEDLIPKANGGSGANRKTANLIPNAASGTASQPRNRPELEKRESVAQQASGTPTGGAAIGKTRKCCTTGGRDRPEIILRNPANL